MGYVLLGLRWADYLTRLALVVLWLAMLVAFWYVPADGRHTLATAWALIAFMWRMEAISRRR
jgi:hypothetical protein